MCVNMHIHKYTYVWKLINLEKVKTKIKKKFQKLKR